jgi:hypothetical protein
MFSFHCFINSQHHEYLGPIKVQLPRGVKSDKWKLNLKMPKSLSIYFKLKTKKHPLVTFFSMFNQTYIQNYKHIKTKWNFYNICLIKPNIKCRNPSLGLATKARAWKVVGQEEARECKKCEWMNLHTPKWTPILGIGIPMDSWIFRRWLQGPKPIDSRNLLYHWKAIET